MTETTNSGVASQVGATEQTAVDGGARKKLMIGAFALVILAGIGWVFAKHQANAIAKDMIDGFLIRHDLRATVSYEGVSGSPFGSAILSDVRVTLSSSAVAKIGTLTITDVDMDGNMIFGFRLIAQAVDVPLLALARDKRRNETLHHAVGLGYTTLRGNIDVGFHFDNETGVLSVDTSGDAADAGNWNLALKLGGLDARFVRSVYDIAKSTGGKALQRLLRAADTWTKKIKKLTFVEASLSLENSDYFQRNNDIPVADIPLDDGAVAPRAVTVSDIELVRGGMNPSEAREAVEALDEWQKEGGLLQIESRSTRSIPLFEEGNLFSPTFDSFEKFLAMTRSRVTH